MAKSSLLHKGMLLGRDGVVLTWEDVGKVGEFKEGWDDPHRTSERDQVNASTFYLGELQAFFPHQQSHGCAQATVSPLLHALSNKMLWTTVSQNVEKKATTTRGFGCWLITPVRAEVTGQLRHWIKGPCPHPLAGLLVVFPDSFEVFHGELVFP